MSDATGACAFMICMHVALSSGNIAFDGWMNPVSYNTGQPSCVLCPWPGFT